MRGLGAVRDGDGSGHVVQSAMPECESGGIAGSPFRKPEGAPDASEAMLLEAQEF
jgi:hypothetical protein